MLGLRTHIVRTANIKKVADWYERVFDKKPYFQNEGYIGFEVGGFEFGVFKADIETAKNHSINIYWGVQDIHTEYKKIVSLGAKTLSKPIEVGGDIIMADFEDPFGNFFGIIYNPTFSAK